MSAYSAIGEIIRKDSGEVVAPLEEWDIEVLDQDLSEDVGDIGGRSNYVCNARVRVTEKDGSQWVGLTRIG